MHNLFPILKSSGYTISSPATIDYNCIAWAAGNTEAWWWPDPFNQYFWPSEAPREESIDAFVKAFEFLGYTICPDSEYEKGYEKVAIYSKPDGSRLMQRDKLPQKNGRAK